MVPSSLEPVWRWSRIDVRALAVLAFLPFAVAAPQLLGIVDADPRWWTGVLASEFKPALLRGWPYLDPNTGFATQALGYRAMLEWLSGTVPWWNYYSGVGLPLAAEYQPGAFFPLTALLLLPHGLTFQHVSLQILSGAGTYALLRQMRLAQGAALTGAIVYTFNGTLAWHAHAPATAVPFLPWMLWGVERAYACARGGEGISWRPIAGAMALGLLCAFPETSYLSGLLSFAWAVVRGVQLERDAIPFFFRAVTLGGVVGIAFAAPQVYAFLHFLGEAYIGGHDSQLANAAFGWHALASSVATPYLLGPLMGYAQDRPLVETIWGGIGGYVTAALWPVAVYGFVRRRDPIGWLLVGWCVMAFGKSFGVEPIVSIFNLIPGVKATAFYRYAPPAWGLALVILAARGIDARVSDPEPSPAGMATARATALAVLILPLGTAVALWPTLGPVPGLRNSAAASIAWAAVTTVSVCLLLASANRSGKVRTLCTVLIVDAMFMAFIPTLGNPRGGKANDAAIGFLRSNLGLQRFFTLGPIAPNYGAYFGIASINHNYLPVARRWVDWARTHLDREIDEVAYVGNYPRKPGAPTEAEELSRNLAAFEWVGVKYVVGWGHRPVFEKQPSIKRVYGDAWMSIYELPAPKPYFESENGRCEMRVVDRANVAATCSGPDRLVRRELYFPGWSARVGERDSPIQPYRELFQSIDLPAGASAIRFSYAPPHIGWAWLAMALAAGAFAFRAPTSLRRGPRRTGRSRSGPTVPPGSASP